MSAGAVCPPSRVAFARPAGDAGAVALLTVWASLVVLTAGLLVLAAVTDVAVAAAQARTAADAAALAAAAEWPADGTGDGCAAARALAEANGAALGACGARYGSEPGTVGVEVEVAVASTSPVTRRLVEGVKARAAAVREPAPPRLPPLRPAPAPAGGRP